MLFAFQKIARQAAGLVAILAFAFFNPALAQAQMFPGQARPEPLQLSDLQARIDQVVIPVLNQQHIPGYALTVIIEGEIVHQRGYGYADLDRRIAVTPNTAFGLASLTKTFTAFALLYLVDQGKVGLDDTLDKYLSNLPHSWQKFTIRQLASMQAGMRKGIPQERPWPEEMKILEHMPLLFPAGSASEYSNPSYRLLGTVIEKVTGQPYGEFLREILLCPLGMYSTGNLEAIAPSGLLSDAYDNQQGNGPLRVIPYKRSAVSFSAGMLASNSRDLAGYAQALLNKKILSPAAYDTLFMHRPPLPSGKPCPWAFGWGSSRKRAFGGRLAFGMNGGDPGVSSTILILPESGLVVIALSNLNNKPVYQLPRMVARTVLGLLEESQGEGEPDDLPGVQQD